MRQMKIVEAIEVTVVTKSGTETLLGLKSVYTTTPLGQWCKAYSFW